MASVVPNIYERLENLLTHSDFVCAREILSGQAFVWVGTTFTQCFKVALVNVYVLNPPTILIGPVHFFVPSWNPLLHLSL